MYLVIALLANIKPKVGETTEDKDDTVDSGGEDIGFGATDDTIDNTIKNTDGAGPDKGFSQSEMATLGANGMNEVFGTV